MEKKILITQSNYIPWKGYFDAMNLVDEVILYDSVQYTKRDWRNRNLIKTQNGLKWLTIPVEVKGKYNQTILETKVSELDWNLRHWRIIEQNYSKSIYFSEYKEFFKDLYLGCEEIYLSKINQHFILGINQILKIDTPIVFSSKFDLVDGKTERLLDLCIKNNATEYYSGPSAKDYLNENLFINKGVSVNYFDYSNYVEYEQCFKPFEHGVTILDLIFNTGPNAIKFMKTFNK